MKLFLVLIAAMILFSCKKESRARELPGDPELFNVEMDRRAAARRKPHPVKPPTNPPAVKSGCLLLDFNGEFVNGTVWNIYINCANSGLSETQIQSVVSRVKYDFSQFGLEVTTDESVFNTYPQNKRRRCIVTTTAFYGNVGGVAYINSFNWFDDTPCFVFSGLLSYNSKYISDAGSHELGHTLGLRHHSDWVYNEDGSCFKLNEY